MSRPILPADAVSLLREAVELNIRDKGRNTRFATERDDIMANLLAAGYRANYADYDHPSEV